MEDGGNPEEQAVPEKPATEAVTEVTQEKQSAETEDVVLEKPDLEKVRNPVAMVKTFWGEIRVAIMLVVPMQIIQFVIYLIVMDKYPSANWPMFVIMICLIGFVSFLFLDKKARDERGASAGAFEVAAGYMWILFCLLFSLLGMVGESFLKSVCKSSGCLATARGIGTFKDYALYILFEGLVMGIVVFALAVARHKKEMEAKKSTSITIEKPKKR